ncbi:MAG: hypothetical protein AVDCRST_MAG88-1456 [uncultured Thermomicrobiales bacterium]|uniref:Nudix hydrolase domain-containing protein n=1 Tax=uncultured Thermomicrobiales bacterium TaxID=1645740 RepID=A0A6J4UZ95_9BACT|nr:MAG: hypothetical protein AVDCRST_MAG88-1456 [uncultured Thermomicrobiales bacterium]
MGEEGTPPQALVQRPSARVILVDREDRVLLFRAVTPRPDGSEMARWVLPGGGVEEGESLIVAAARELHEETGLLVAPARLRGPVARSRGAWRFQGVDYWSEVAFFFLRIAAWDLSPADLGPLEREQAANYRWWAIADVGSTRETVFPRGLAPLVTRLVAGEFPVPPVDLPW